MNKVKVDSIQERRTSKGKEEGRTKEQSKKEGTEDSNITCRNKK